MKPSTPPDTTFQYTYSHLTIGWRWARRVYAVLAGLLVTGLCLVLLRSQLDPAEQALAAIGLGAVVACCVGLAFRASRKTLLRLASALRAPIEAYQPGDAPLEIPPTGCTNFDRLGASVLALTARAESLQIRTQIERDNFQRLADESVGIEAYFSPRGRLLWVSSSIERLTGLSIEECIASNDLIAQWVYPKDHTLMRDLAERGLRGEGRDDHELRITHRDGTVTWYACRWHARRDADNNILGVRFSAQNIQRRKDAELKLLETVAALRRAQALKDHYLNRSNEERMRLSALLDIVNLGIVFIDRDHRVVYINQPALDLWHLGERDSVVGMRDEVLIDRTVDLRADDEDYRANLDTIINDRSRSHSPAYDIQMRDGRVINELSAIVRAVDGERAIGRVWIYEDVTAERKISKHLTDLAERDPLTGLYNRRRFIEELDRQLLDNNRRHEQLGLLSFDLDGFKAINDRFGHQAGDEVLLALANAVGGVVRRNEILFRLGGDEFALLVANTDEERMVQLASRVLERIRELDFEFDAQAAVITVSLGIALAPIHADSSAALIASADRAMYAAKEAGKNRWKTAHHPKQQDQKQQ